MPDNDERPRATDIAYERLSQAIISLELAPGTLVNERELCTRLGVTRLTLVPALHRLAETGLVSILARRGVIIAPVDVRDAQQVFAARSAMEAKVAELAAVRSTPAEVAAFKALSRGLHSVGPGGRGYSGLFEKERPRHKGLGRNAG